MVGWPSTTAPTAHQYMQCIMLVNSNSCNRTCIMASAARTLRSIRSRMPERPLERRAEDGMLLAEHEQRGSDRLNLEPVLGNAGRLRWEPSPVHPGNDVLIDAIGSGSRSRLARQALSQGRQAAWSRTGRKPAGHSPRALLPGWWRGKGAGAGAAAGLQCS